MNWAPAISSADSPHPVSYAYLHTKYHAGKQLSLPLRTYARAARRPPPAGGFFYDDEIEHARLVSAIDPYEAQQHALIESGATPLLRGLAEVENENCRKTCHTYFRHRPDGYCLFTEPLVNRGPPAWYDATYSTVLAWLRRLGALVDQDDLPSHRDLRVRVGTSGGWPTYAPGSEQDQIEHAVVMRQKLVHRLPFRDAVDQLRSLSRSVHQGLVGSDPLTVRFNRVQGSGKGWPACRNEPGQQQLKVWTDPVSGKHRAVFAFGVYANMYKWGLHAALFRMLHSVPFFPDTVSAAMQYLGRLKRQGLELIPEDISSFDLSISDMQLQGALDAICYYFTHDARLWRCFDPLDIQSLPDVLRATAGNAVITPALTDDPFACMEWEKVGTQSSGSQITSVLGSILNGGDRIIQKYAFIKNVSVTQAVNDLFDGKWGFVCQSDDTVLALPPGMRADWDQLSFMGYRTTTQGWPVYLQRVMDFDRGLHFGIIARMWSGMINREVPREPRDPDVVRMGIQVRRELLRGHPYANAFDDLCATTPAIAPYYGEAIQHPLAWHERNLATKLRNRAPNDPDLNAVWDWVSTDDPASLGATADPLLIHALASRRTASVRELTAHCLTVDDSRMAQSALKRLEMSEIRA